MPYAIRKSNDVNLRDQVTKAVNMGTVQNVIAKHDTLVVPADCQSILYGTMTVNGELTISGELVVTGYP